MPTHTSYYCRLLTLQKQAIYPSSIKEMTNQFRNFNNYCMYELIRCSLLHQTSRNDLVSYNSMIDIPTTSTVSSNLVYFRTDYLHSMFVF